MVVILKKTTIYSIKLMFKSRILLHIHTMIPLLVFQQQIISCLFYVYKFKAILHLTVSNNCIFFIIIQFQPKIWNLIYKKHLTKSVFPQSFSFCLRVRSCIIKSCKTLSINSMKTAKIMLRHTIGMILIYYVYNYPLPSRPTDSKILHHIYVKYD